MDIERDLQQSTFLQLGIYSEIKVRSYIEGILKHPQHISAYKVITIADVKSEKKDLVVRP